jgi:hypothetical protein
MNNIIRVKDMLSIMDMRDTSGEHIPFSIEMVTCNEKTGEGGEIISFEKAIQCGGAKSNSKLRNPNNFENYMRNIISVGGDRITKIDPWCVRKFNEMEVLL